MREVHAIREVEKRNGSSQDRQVACVREIHRAGKAAAESVLKSCDAGRVFESGARCDMGMRGRGRGRLRKEAR
jgi:hypothetical protein